MGADRGRGEWVRGLPVLAWVLAGACSYDLDAIPAYPVAGSPAAPPRVPDAATSPPIADFALPPIVVPAPALGPQATEVETPRSFDPVAPIPCEVGFARGEDGACSDIDECAAQPCEPPATCRNLPSTFVCDCPAGYLTDTAGRCVDLDECAQENECAALAFCDNTAGSYRCRCPAYYTSVARGRECRDDRLLSALTMQTYQLAAAVDGADFVLAGLIGDLPVELDGVTLPAATQYDVFVAKLEADHRIRWLRRFDSASMNHLDEIAIDSAGDVLVKGYTYGGLDFGAGPVETDGARALFVVKLAGSDGATRWSQVVHDLYVEPAAPAPLGGLAVDAWDNVLIVGAFNAGPLTIGGVTLAHAGGFDVFVAKLGPAGELQWAERFGGAGDEVGVAVDSTAFGNIAIAGSFDTAISFADTTLTTAGGEDIFVALIDFTGAFSWARRAGGSGSDRVTGMVVDPSDGIVVGGYFEGELSAGDETHASQGGWDGYLAAWGAKGAHRWSRTFGDAGTDYVESIDVGPDGEIVTAAGFHGSVSLGEGAFASRGSLDIAVAKHAPDGELIWARAIGGSAHDNPQRVQVAASGRIAVTGGSVGPLDLDVVAVDDYAMFVVELAP